MSNFTNTWSAFVLVLSQFNRAVENDLSGADLSGANLSGADLSGANLRAANLRAANLSGADLSGANLRAANLSYANLRAANLRAANLSGANLSGADLSGANLSYANLRAAKGFYVLPMSHPKNYNFYAVLFGDEWRIRAGCHGFTIEDAKNHWGKNYKNSDGLTGEDERRIADDMQHAIAWLERRIEAEKGKS